VDRGGQRSRRGAVVLPGVFPGLGQTYNRQQIKGAATVIAGAVLSWLIGRAIPGKVDMLMAAPLGTNAMLLACLLLAIWIWSGHRRLAGRGALNISAICSKSLLVQADQVLQ
jgi:hypothetical protein